MAICAASARRSSPSFWDKDRRCCGDNLEKQSVGWLASWKNNRKKKSDFEKFFCDLKRKKLEDFADVNYFDVTLWVLQLWRFRISFSIEVTL